MKANTISDNRDEYDYKEIDRLVPEWERLFKSLKPQISDEYRCSDDPDDNTPGMQVTIGFTPSEREDFEVTDNDVTQCNNVHPDTGSRLSAGKYSAKVKDCSWHYQTGDNSYSGGAYGHAHWAVISLYRRSNSRELAKQAADEIAESVSQSM
jgi:hypothetical protein